MRNQSIKLTGLSHADTAVDNGQRLVGFVGNKSYKEFRLTIQLALVRQALEAYLVQSLNK